MQIDVEPSSQRQNDINHKSSTDRRAGLVKQGRGGPPRILFRMERWSVDIQAIRFVEELTLHEVALYVTDLYRGTPKKRGDDQRGRVESSSTIDARVMKAETWRSFLRGYTSFRIRAGGLNNCLEQQQEPLKLPPP